MAKYFIAPFFLPCRRNCPRPRQASAIGFVTTLMASANHSMAYTAQISTSSASTSSNLAPDSQLLASCHCGRITLQLPSAPKKVLECHCSICYKYGVTWAYFRRQDVKVSIGGQASGSTGKTMSDLDARLDEYVRADEESGGRLGFYRCGHCGCMTHWWRLADNAKRCGKGSMGVNARMLPESALEGVPRSVSSGPPDWAVKAFKFMDKLRVF